MTLLPVIARELRASARQPFTYNLRVLGVGVLLGVSLWFGLHLGFAPGLGRVLFARLHLTLFFAIWVLVPMLTADCLSRERREGTLGLLFLTPLKGTDIVVAKTLTQGLRALTLGLAVLPVLTLPFLLGGVSWSDAALSVMVNFNAICWALAAGLLASAWNKAWLQSLLWAGILAVTFLLILSVGAGWLRLLAHHAGRPGRLEVKLSDVLGVGFFLLTNAPVYWSGFIPPRIASVSTLFLVLGQTTFLSLFVLAAAVLAAGAKTRRSWQEEPPSRQRVWLERTFCTPVLWLSFFHWWMRRKLDRNPIGWLEQRTWSGRLVTWGWFAVLVSVYSTLLSYPQFVRNPNALQEFLAWLLAGSMAMSAAGSFQRERETGVLELLLVSPLGENRIISGRLGGLWSQFFPATGLLLSVWIYFSTFLPGARDEAGPFLYAAASFLTVPVFGLYFSLRCRNFLTAFLATIAVGLLLPLVLPETIAAIRWTYASSNPVFTWDLRPSAPAALCQGILAVFFWDRLFLRLKKRAFPLERTEA